MQSIAFRPLAVDDLPQVFAWLLQPHVSKWYAPQPTSFMEVVAKYGPRTEAGNAVQSFIVSVDGADAGYIQTYAIASFPGYAALLECGEGVAGIDFFIGERALLRQGVGSRVVRQFVDDMVFARNGAGACVAGPSEGNTASILTLERAGFSQWKRVKPESGDPECVLRKERGGG